MTGQTHIVRATREGSCSALIYRNHVETCTNGFPINAGCVGITGAVPYCCNERFCGRLWPETGAPDRCQVQP